ncbi:MAG: HRDC domain-containing protein [archaeon]|nr:HRDC domain-containing protein [archaeon]
MQSNKRERPNQSLGDDTPVAQRARTTSKAFEVEEVGAYVRKVQHLLSRAVSLTARTAVWNDRDDFQFYAVASQAEFEGLTGALNQQVLGLIQRVLQQPNSGDPIGPYTTVDFVKLLGSSSAPELLDHFDPIVEFNDVQLEKIDTYSDRRHSSSQSSSASSSSSITTAGGLSKLARLSGAVIDMDKLSDDTDMPVASVGRPQLSFEDLIDNSDAPFIPKILEKPNALVPLDPLWVERARVRALSRANTLLSNNMLPEVLPSTSTNPDVSAALREHMISRLGLDRSTVESESAPHPYEDEIDALEYLDSQLGYQQEPELLPLESTPLLYLTVPSQLDELVEKLRQAPVVAIDLEHHDYRSYQGFTCLIQISTATEDFIIDPLPLRAQLHRLNEVFTDPAIVKVLHGCDSDVLWLQRDFGVYLVNVFDTGQAARVMELPHFSLAYLLEQYCGVKLDKQYQLADWRLRPLPLAMINYARMDTHYLILLYIKLKNELIVRGNETLNLLRSTLLRSKELTKLRYEKEPLTSSSHLNVYNKSNFIFNPVQMSVFTKLFQWRDTIARQEDESTRYILPNHILLHIAHVSPITTEQLFHCCQVIPPYLRIHALEIVDIINEAKKQTPSAIFTASDASLQLPEAVVLRDFAAHYRLGDFGLDTSQLPVFSSPLPVPTVSSAPENSDFASFATHLSAIFRDERPPAANHQLLLDIGNSFDLLATVTSFKLDAQAGESKSAQPHPPLPPSPPPEPELLRAMKGKFSLAPTKPKVTPLPSSPSNTASSKAAKKEISKQKRKNESKHESKHESKQKPSAKSSAPPSDWQPFDYSKVAPTTNSPAASSRAPRRRQGAAAADGPEQQSTLPTPRQGAKGKDFDPFAAIKDNYKSKGKGKPSKR